VNLWLPRIKILELEPPRPRGTLCGRVKIIGRLPDGRSRIWQEWHPNLLTTAGLNYWGSGPDAIITYASVGSGTTPPDSADTALQTFIAEQNVLSLDIKGCSAESPYYSFFRKMWTLPPPGVQHTVSEVGFGRSVNGTDLWSHSLVKDLSGNPYAITWLPDESLDIFYELRRYIWTDDTGIITVVNGEDHTGIIRGANVIDSALSIVRNGQQRIALRPDEILGETIFACTGAIGVVTSKPDGIHYGASPSENAYATGDFYRFGVANWTAALDIGNINSFLVECVIGCWQWSVVPAIPKPAQTLLSLGVVSPMWAEGPIP